MPLESVKNQENIHTNVYIMSSRLMLKYTTHTTIPTEVLKEVRDRPNDINVV